MHKPAANGWVKAGEMMQHPVHQVVADIRPGGVGKACRDARSLNCLDHGLDWKGCKIRGCPFGGNGPIHRLVAVVIRDPGVIDIDGDALRGQAEASARLADAEHRIRVFPVNGGTHGFNRLAEDHRHRTLYNLCVGNSVPHQGDGFLRGVDGLAAEGLKGCDQDFHNKLRII